MNSPLESIVSSFKKTKRILKKHFKQDTQLYREFRLFNSLVTTTASKSDVYSFKIFNGSDIASVGMYGVIGGQNYG